MPTKKKVTVKQLDRLIEKEDAYIPKCIAYREALVKYREDIISNKVGTTPPGPHPKNPPGLTK